MEHGPKVVPGSREEAAALRTIDARRDEEMRRDGMSPRARRREWVKKVYKAGLEPEEIGRDEDWADQQREEAFSRELKRIARSEDREW